MSKSKYELLAHLDHRLFRPFLSKYFPPEFVIKIYSLGRDRFLQGLAEVTLDVDFSSINRPVSCFKNNLVFRNDLGNAAGFNKDGHLLEFNYQIGAGFELLGTVLNNPHTGNLFPCFGIKRNPWTPLHFSNSALNSLGLPSKGVKYVRERILKFRNSHDLINYPIGVSLMGHPLADDSGKMDGVLESMEILSDCVDFFEINESCPNTEHNSNQEALEQRISRIMQKRESFKRYLPVLIKLGDFGDLTQTLEYYNNLNVDGLSFSNTSKNYSGHLSKIATQDLNLFNYYINKYQGGLSGQVIKRSVQEQLELAADYINRKQLNIKLIHIGGLATHADLENSRSINLKHKSDIVILRQWYTGLMHSLATKSFKKVYAEVI